MPSLKDLRLRIISVKSTQKITKAMQMVAAAKLRRAQEQAERARPYSERMERLMAALAANMLNENEAPPLMVGSGRDQVHLVVVVTAERGLCGAFNSAVARAASARVNALLREGKQVKIFCLGRKGAEILRRNHAERIIETYSLREVRRVDFQTVQPVAQKIRDMFDAGDYDVCTVVYNAFRSVVSQVVTWQQLVPVEVPDASAVSGPDLKGAIYEYEPDEQEILADLVPRNLAVQLYKAVLESQAAEQAARMTAMDNATRNAGDMIGDLTLRYNRTRQAIITKELIEIVSGAEAL